jgi:hypothetical protein
MTAALTSLNATGMVTVNGRSFIIIRSALTPLASLLLLQSFLLSLDFILNGLPLQ